MVLWAVLTVIVGVVAAALTVPLVRRHEVRAGNRGAAATSLAETLADIDIQAAAGTVSAPEAEGLRIEARRRMLSQARTPDAAARPLGTAALGRLAIALAAFVAVAATALYSTLGRPDLATEAPATATASAAAPAGQPSAGEIDAMVAQLEKRMAGSPNDAEGWRMLGWSYFQTAKFQRSADAYARAVKLAPTGPGYASAYGEALVQAATGVVSPEARQQFEAARALDANDARARYFIGVSKEQAGDHKGALDDWLKLLAEAPADAPWAPELRRVAEQTAKGAGIDISARLPAAPSVTAAPNPSAEQVQAVQAMAPADQQAMIRGMVDNLAAKLKANPRDPQGWVRLIRARMVLGDAAAARAAKADALAALKGDAAGTAAVEQGAAASGI